MAEYRQETVTSTAVSVNNTGRKFATALVTPTGANLRLRDDGTDPTTTIGVTVFQNGSYVINGWVNVDKAKVIAESGTATVGIRLA
jgi:hypothetical protein